MDNFLDGLFSSAVSAEVFPHRYSPDFYPSNRYECRADGWRASQGRGTERDEFKDPGDVLDVEVRLNGGGHLFCGRAAETLSDGRFVIFENIVAGLTMRFITLLGGLYTAGNYLGPVDVGLAVTELEGSVSSVLRQRIGVHGSAFDQDQYRRTERFSAATLMNDPRSAARKLVLPLARATTRESYDPFSD